MALSVKDLDYYKATIKDDEQEHNTKLKEVNNPEAVIAMYEGRLANDNNPNDINADAIIENHLLIAVNTILPTLFYQVPRAIVTTEREDLRYSASVLDALARQYFGDSVKAENQLCILDAFLPYYFGVMKVGYNSRTGKYAPPSLLTGQSKTSGDPKNIEANCEYLKFESPVLVRHSPRYTFMDASKPFGKGKRITFMHKRTLAELKSSNLYNLSANFLKYFESRTKDDRQVEFDLTEHFRIQEDGVYKLVYIKEWDEELLWSRTSYKELPCSLLRFNKTPDSLYGVSHGAVGAKAQKELNYLNRIWKEHVDKVRRQHLIDGNALTEPGRRVLKANEVDGIVECNRPVTSGVYAQISSNPMGQDVYANIENVRNYLKMIFSVSGGRMGKSDVEFAETEKNQQTGDMMRMSGLQDAIRDFCKDQIRKMVTNLVKFGNPEITVRITGKDVRDPVTGEIITGKELQFGGDNGLNLQSEIMGDIDTDYNFDVDITSATRPDFAVIRQQLADGIQLATSLRPIMQEKGKDIDITEMVKDYFNSYDTIPNPQKYIVDLSEDEKAMLQMKQQMDMAGAVKSPPKGGTPMPNPEAQVMEIPGVGQ